MTLRKMRMSIIPNTGISLVTPSKHVFSQIEKMYLDVGALQVYRYFPKLDGPVRFPCAYGPLILFHDGYLW